MKHLIEAPMIDAVPIPYGDSKYYNSSKRHRLYAKSSLIDDWSCLAVDKNLTCHNFTPLLIRQGRVSIGQLKCSHNGALLGVSAGIQHGVLLIQGCRLIVGLHFGCHGLENRSRNLL